MSIPFCSRMPSRRRSSTRPLGRRRRTVSSPERPPGSSVVGYSLTSPRRPTGATMRPTEKPSGRGGELLPDLLDDVILDDDLRAAHLFGEVFADLDIDGAFQHA